MEKKKPMMQSIEDGMENACKKVKKGADKACDKMEDMTEKLFSRKQGQ